ncbi:MAG: alpha/beta fold hydrolase [Actinomycetes bacterium]
MEHRSGLFVATSGTPTPDGAPPLLALHGFAQNHRCLGPVVATCATDRLVLTPDAPGHGESSRVRSMGVPATAELLTRIIDDMGGPVDVFGYSMGGRIALQFAVHHPELVRRLVLVGATAGIRSDAERAERAARDAATASHIGSIGVEAFTDEWLSQPLFATLPPDARFEDERRTNTADGLADSLRHAGTGSMAPLWDRLGAVDAPTLCIAGALDAAYCSLADELAAGLPHATSVRIPGAGHAAHLEAPDAVTELVVAFLDQP